MHSEISVTNGAAHSVDETALIAIQIADNSESVLRLRAAASREGLTASRQVDPSEKEKRKSNEGRRPNETRQDASVRRL